MKTRMFLAVVALLGLFFWQEAQAFYNPSSGRWLSRDPLEEPGFGLVVAGLQSAGVELHDVAFEERYNLHVERSRANLYAFVANVPTTKFDRLGLYGEDDYPRNWGNPGPITSRKGAYGPMYDTQPNWFMHNPDEGKPCCGCCADGRAKDGPARMRGSREDEVALSAIGMVLDLHITGCYKDLFLIWDTCWRFDSVPWGSESSDAIPDAVNSLTARIWAWGTVYRTKAHVRLLSCENGKWKSRGAMFGRSYTRSTFLSIWSWTDSTFYY